MTFHVISICLLRSLSWSICNIFLKWRLFQIIFLINQGPEFSQWFYTSTNTLYFFQRQYFCSLVDGLDFFHNNIIALSWSYLHTFVSPFERINLCFFFAYFGLRLIILNYNTNSNTNITPRLRMRFKHCIPSSTLIKGVRHGWTHLLYFLFFLLNFIIYHLFYFSFF